jgi:hypothetical protein
MVARNESYVIETVHGVRQRISLTSIHRNQDFSSESTNFLLRGVAGNSESNHVHHPTSAKRLDHPGPTTSNS